jgi:uracil-DNA glycosylase
MSDEIANELTDCLEQLRWIFAGYRAGGVCDWHHNPVKTAEPIAPESAAKGGCTVMEISDALAGCKRCGLHSGRTNLVFGEGSTRSGLIFVGEGPGFDEDRQGRPFVGKAGKLLDKMIRAIGLEREEVYICNVVKCRPPDNRTPQPEEVAACSPFLFKQIEALGPRVICALGACAAQTLLGNARPVSQTRGRIHLWRGIPLICTFHPAYLLRNAAQKAATWQDLKEVLKVLDSGSSE